MRIRLVLLIGLIVVTIAAVKSCASRPVREQVAGPDRAVMPTGTNTIAAEHLVVSNDHAMAAPVVSTSGTDHDQALASMTVDSHKAAVLDSDLLANRLRSVPGVSTASVQCAASACRLHGTIASEDVAQLDQRLEAIKADYESMAGGSVKLNRSNTAYSVRGNDPITIEFSEILFAK